MRRRKRGLSGEEEELWRLAVRDVKPLDVTPPAVTPDAAQATDKPRGPVFGPVRRPVRRQVFLSDLLQSPARNSPPSRPVPEPLVGSAPNRQWDRTLKRGDMEIDARLDLHGQTELQAHRRLVRFVIEAAAVDARRLLIITGKGRTGQGLLKARLPGWLAEGDLRPLVMAVHPAHVKDGGDGAYYVILRRRRG